MMTRISKVLRQVADRGLSSSIAPASGKVTVKNPRENGLTVKNPSRENGLETSSELLTQLQAFFESREHELKEREATLEKKHQLFQQTYPHAGNHSDVLHLNVGGSTNVAVLRRTLTRFEDSMLASQFSGRWDDSLPKTKCGSFFIDQDPNVFVPLLSYLRQCDQKTCNEMKIVPPDPSPEFCLMLEYYGLMSHVYPKEKEGSATNRESTNDDSMAPCHSNKAKAVVLEAKSICSVQPVNATTFTVVFEKGSKGKVGWRKDCASDDDEDSSDSDDESDDEYFCESDEDCGNVDSFHFDVASCHFMVDGRRKKSLWTWSQQGPLTIECRWDAGSKTYSIHSMENDRIDPIIKVAIRNERQMFPFITFEGKVTISTS